MKDLNIGLVGYGFMGRTHSNAFLHAPKFFDVPYRPVLKAVCARNPDRAKSFAANWGYESVEADWRDLVARQDIDLIDIASPNDTHKEIAVAAARAGKMVMCEKPLGRTAAEAKSMVEAVEAAGVPNSVWYNYRRVPAVTLIKQLIDEGKLGRIFHYRAQFLQDWTISQDLHRLQWFDHKDEGQVRGWRSVHVTDGDHPYMKRWWVPGLQIGYEHTFIHQFADFLQAVGAGKPCPPTFRDGLATDYVTDAVLASAKSHKWVDVAKA